MLLNHIYKKRFGIITAEPFYFILQLKSYSTSDGAECTLEASSLLSI